MKYSKLTFLSRVLFSLSLTMLDTAAIWLLATKQFNCNVTFWFCMILLILTRLILKNPFAKLEYDNETPLISIFLMKAITPVALAIYYFFL